MPSSIPERIKGAKLTVTLGGIDVDVNASNVRMSNEALEGDVVTFDDARKGGTRQHFLTITALQSTSTDSFWRYLWANTGLEAPFVFRPHGNAVATAAQPHFTGTVKIPAKPDIGGEAGATVTWTFDTRLDLVGEPVLDDATTLVPKIAVISPASTAALKVIQISGSRFSGTTAVTVKGTTAPFTILSDNQLAVYVPATVAGAAPVIVTNAAGASVASNITIV